MSVCCLLVENKPCSSPNSITVHPALNVYFPASPEPDAGGAGLSGVGPPQALVSLLRRHSDGHPHADLLRGGL